MKILVLHPSGAFGGASKSIISAQVEVGDSIDSVTVICPLGSSVSRFSSNGYTVRPVVGISQFDNTRYGFYRKARWFILLRELYYFFGSYRIVKSEVVSNDFDLIHINEITLLPWARIIKRWTSAPVLMHVRSLQREVASDWRTRFSFRLLSRDVDAIIAIDETVRASLPRELPVTVIHNSLQVVDRKKGRESASGPFRVAIIGVLLKLKGVYEFLEAVRILVKERGLEIEFYIVGENARELSGWKARILKLLDLAHDVEDDIKRFIAVHSLEKNVVLTGFVEDVQNIYENLDVLCFPSHLNAAGRPVFEAAFFGVPSIVAVKDPPPDTIIDGETGICIDEPDGRLLADAIERLFNNRDELEYLGANAQELAKKNFSIEKNSQALLQVYRDLVSKNN